MINFKISSRYKMPDTGFQIKNKGVGATLSETGLHFWGTRKYVVVIPDFL